MATTTSRPRCGRTCVIYNPTARGEKATSLRRYLEGLRDQCELMPTRKAGDALVLAAEAVRGGFETIVAVGGDGTVHEVVNGIAGVPDGLARVRVGLLPAGTVNVFARELGVPFAIDRAWEIIRQGEERVIDLPEMEWADGGGKTRRCFVQMAGCGLDARAVELVNWELKKKYGQLAYVIAGMKALRENAPTIDAFDGSKCFSGKLVLIGNGRLYGGPIPVFELAELRDGRLDVCVFPRVNWFVVLRYACAYLSPKLLWRGAERSFQAERVRLQSPSRVPLELDGEPAGQLPATCSIGRQGLRMLVPPDRVPRDLGKR